MQAFFAVLFVGFPLWMVIGLCAARAVSGNYSDNHPEEVSKLYDHFNQ